MTPTPSPTRWLLPREAVGIAGAHRKTLARWAADGRIKVRVTLGGHRRYEEASLRQAAAQWADWAPIPRPGQGPPPPVPAREPAQWIRPREAATLAGVTSKTLRAWVDRGLVVRRDAGGGRVELLRATVETAMAARDRRRLTVAVQRSQEGHP